WERYLCFLPGGLQARWRNDDGSIDGYAVAQQAKGEHSAVREFIWGARRSPADWIRRAGDWGYEPSWKSLLAEHRVFATSQIGGPNPETTAAAPVKNPDRQAGGKKRFANSRAGKTHQVLYEKWLAANASGVRVDRA